MHTSACFVEASCPSLGLLAYGGAPGLYKDLQESNALFLGGATKGILCVGKDLYAWASFF